MTHRSSIYLSLAALALLFVLYFLSSLGMLGDSPVGQTAVDTEPLIVPAGYAFAIWGVIYIGLIVFPIYQLIKKKDSHPLWHQVRIWYSLNVVANGLWLAFASYNWLWTTVLIISFMLVSLYRINQLLLQIEASDAPINFWTERLVFSLYFAWITLATALNISAALNFYDWNGFGLSDATWSLIILPIVAAIASVVFWKYRDRAYASVVIWAFIALVVKHWEAFPMLAYVAIAVIVLFVAYILLGGRKPVQSLATG